MERDVPNNIDNYDYWVVNRVHNSVYLYRDDSDQIALIPLALTRMTLMRAAPLDYVDLDDVHLNTGLL